MSHASEGITTSARARIPTVTRSTARGKEGPPRKIFTPPGRNIGRRCRRVTREHPVDSSRVETALHGSMSGRGRGGERRRTIRICSRRWPPIFHGNNQGLMIDQLIPLSSPTHTHRSGRCDFEIEPSHDHGRPPREMSLLHNIDVNSAPKCIESGSIRSSYRFSLEIVSFSLFRFWKILS